MSKLTFDPVEHAYRLNGRLVPSVTEALRLITADEYAGVDADVMAKAAAIGTAVHGIIERDIRGEFDIEACDVDLLPYFDQWRQFLQTSGFEPRLSEARVYSERYGYAGTLDLFGRLNRRWALIDAKRTAKVPRTAGPQTAAYEMALRECRPDLFAGEDKRIDRFALHLAPSGWRLVPFKDPNDQRVFLSALTLHTWRKAA